MTATNETATAAEQREWAELVVTCPGHICRARALVGRLTAGAGCSENAILAASELVANALAYTGSPCRLRGWANALTGAVRVEVDDSSMSFPLLTRATSAATEHGRGLMIVAAVTSRWGVEMRPPAGKTVWFEIDAGTSA